MRELPRSQSETSFVITGLVHQFYRRGHLFLHLRQFFLRGKKLATANASTVIPNAHVKV
jgi:hypothetical protein